MSLFKTKRLVVLEECVEQGSAGQKIAQHIAEGAIELESLRLLNLGSQFIPHGTIDELRAEYGIDEDSVVRAVTEELAR